MFNVATHVNAGRLHYKLSMFSYQNPIEHHLLGLPLLRLPSISTLMIVHGSESPLSLRPIHLLCFVLIDCIKALSLPTVSNTSHVFYIPSRTLAAFSLFFFL